MYGWRLRIGAIVPSSNTTFESELWQMALTGVSIHTSRMLLGKVDEKDLILMEEHVEKAVVELATAKVDVIAFACTTGSLVKGKGYDRQIADKITSIAGIPAVTTSTAVIDALGVLGIKKVGVVTPYSDELNAKEAAFLEAHGVKVEKIIGLGLLDNTVIGNQESKVPYRMVKELGTRDCDGYFISCTNFRSIEIIDILENELCKPVISSNQATLAAILKKGGMSLKPIVGYGSLFSKW